MPAIALSISSGCNADGTGFIRFTSIGGTGAGPFAYTVDGSLIGNSFTGSIDRSELPFMLEGLANDTYSVSVADTGGGSASGTRTAVISCTAPTGGTPPAAGSFIRYECREADRYEITADGQGGELAALFETNSASCGYVAPAQPAACGNPDADNYQPGATTIDNTLCEVSPKLRLDDVPDLVPLGRPVVVTLHSADILWPDYTPAKAQAFITVEGPAAGAMVQVNGETLTVGSPTQPGRFEDAETLLEALLALPLLAAQYSIRRNDDTSVLLEAREVGTAYNLRIASSTTPGLSVTMVAGRDELHSQRRIEYGCWLEVWAVPGALFGPGQPRTGAVLAASFESRYREDNAYSFDIAECLRQYTSLDYDVSGRLTGYFLRFGETYAEDAGGFRRKRKVGESNVLFGLEAVEVMPPAVLVDGSGVPLGNSFPYEFPIAFDGSGGGSGTLAGWRRLSRRPGRVPLVGVLATVLNPTYGGPLLVSAQTRAATGGLSGESGAGLAAGGLTSITVAAGASGAEVERSTVSIAGNLLVVGEAAPATDVLTFANGQGGLDSVPFVGGREPVAQRSLSSYATTTGSRTRQAELPERFRLSTGLLTAEVYAWLLAELGNSAAVWLETKAGPVAVNLTDFDANADVVAGEYSLSVVVEPCEQPARGLTN